MKKTITMLCTSAFLALSAQADFTLNYSSSGSSSAPVASFVNENGELDETSVQTEVNITNSSLAANAPSTDYLVGSEFARTAYTINTNVGNGGTWTMTLTFTLLEDMALDNLAITLITADSNGNAQYNHRVPQLSYTLSSSDSASPLAEGSNSMTITGSTGSIVNGTATRNEGTFNFDVDESLKAGTTYTLTLDAARAESSNAGYYLGVKSIGFTAAIPEPATATLSLLALAGLAARRRRR